MLKLLVFLSLLGSALSTYCPDPNQVWDNCGSACPPTCHTLGKDIACIQVCVKGCRCKYGLITVKEPSGKIRCITRDKCPGQACRGGQIWNNCGSACPKTCARPAPPCTDNCVKRCECPPYRPIQSTDVHGNIICIKQEQCCKGDLVFNPCGSACPGPSCDPHRKLVACTLQCVPKCTCPKDRPIEISPGRCIRREQCPQQCKGGQVWKQCGSACVRTCARPVMPCTRQCVPRCECPPIKPLLSIDIHGNRICVSPSQCCKGDLVFNHCGSMCSGPSCDPNWKPVACLAPCRPKCTCPRDRPIEISPGRCISRDQCPRPQCKGGQVWKQCGSACVRTCARPVGPCTKQCVTRCECPPIKPLLSIDFLGNRRCVSSSQCCKGDLVFNHCGSMCPGPSCDPNWKPIACKAACRPKCTCPRDRPIEISPGRCISRDQCPRPQCKGGQVWKQCGSACVRTCAKPIIPCTKQCVPRCECPTIKPLLSIDIHGNRICVSPSQCCKGDLVFHHCGSMCPGPSCDPNWKPILCKAACRPKCTCPRDRPIEISPGRCISRDQCPRPQCKGGQIWKQCGSACVRTCDKPVVLCTKQCVPRCECPSDRPLLDRDINGSPKCFSQAQCCRGHLVFNQCGSACPGPSCDPHRKPVPCTRQCVPKCTCPRDRPIQIRPGFCIRRDQCPPQQCKGGQIWKECGSACVRTCEKPEVPCTRQCVRRCECPPEKPLRVIDINGQIRCVSKGQCCPVGKVFNPCGSACPPTCNPPPGPRPCPRICKIGCTCPKDKPIEIKDKHGNFVKCISADQCPPRECPGDLVFNRCGSACNRTCSIPDPVCTEQCVTRCECPRDRPLQREIYGRIKCIKEDQCCDGDLVFNQCGSTCPPPTCGPPPKDPIACPAVCVAKCTCPRDRPIQIKPGKCISRDECPPPQCEGDLVFKRCGSACNRTCSIPNPVCTKQCVARCECPQDRPLQREIHGRIKCIKEDQCCDGDLVFNECGSACPPPTCEPPPKDPIVCPAVCVAKCTCPRDRPIQIKPGRCISRDECPPPQCQGGQVFTKCGSACTRTCTDQNPPCTKQCVAKCQCPKKRPFWHNGKCLNKKQCKKVLKKNNNNKGKKGKKQQKQPKTPPPPQTTLKPTSPPY